MRFRKRSRSPNSTDPARANWAHQAPKGCYYDTHRLIHEAQEIVLDRPDWEWADFDRHRLVWVEKGILYQAPITAQGVGDVNELYDFNPMEFQAIPAPY